VRIIRTNKGTLWGREKRFEILDGFWGGTPLIAARRGETGLTEFCSYNIQKILNQLIPLRAPMGLGRLCGNRNPALTQFWRLIILLGKRLPLCLTTHRASVFLNVLAPNNFATQFGFLRLNFFLGKLATGSLSGKTP
tara:strand:- start:3185 stop:3595 length:411 start_codon:yes stop_codon:yes gene_type:complete